MIHERVASSRAWKKEGDSGEDKSPSYFFFTVIYENVCRSRAVNGNLWFVKVIQREHHYFFFYPENLGLTVMNRDLLTQAAVFKRQIEKELRPVYL